MRERSAGVRLLALLEAILGILLFLGFVALTILSFGLPELFPHMRLLFPVRLFVVAVVLLLLSVVEFTLAFGIWSGMSWAWAGSIGFALLGIVFAIFSLFLRPGIGEVISLIINLLIVYYLMKPQVHAYFTKGVAVAK